MAVVDNRSLHILRFEASKLEHQISVAEKTAHEAETAFNRAINDKATMEKDLKNIQDAIALLSKPKKGKKDASQD